MTNEGQGASDGLYTAGTAAAALRQAAEAAVSDTDGIPWDDDHDRATVAAWLEQRADDIEDDAARRMA